MKKLLTTLFVLCIAVSAMAQAGLKGKVLNESTGEPIVGAIVTLANQNISTTTNEAGEFQLVYLDAIEEEIIIDADGFVSGIEIVSLKDKETITIEALRIQPDLATSQLEEVYINISEQEMNDDEGRTQEQASAASSSVDVFNNVTSFAWSTARYRNRGYEQMYETNYIEGLNFSSAERGQFNFSAMGGLNDASRYKETVNPLEATNFTFGNIGRSTNYLMSASNYAAGWKIGVAGTNRNYKAALRATYASGPLKNDWFVAAQIAFRFSPYIDDKGNIGEGNDYYSLGYFVTAEKRWKDGRHRLSFLTFGAPTTRGSSGAVTQEVYNLTNQYNPTQWGWNNYNPWWGYQNGKVRNAATIRSYDPTFIASYDFKISDNQKIHAAVGAHYSFYSKSGFAWYNAPDPRPDYYRNLPSFLFDGQLNSNGAFIRSDYAGRPLGATDENGILLTPLEYNGVGVGHSVDYASYKTLTDLWTSRDTKTTQVDWDAMYTANYANNILNPDGCAHYIVLRRHNDIAEVLGSFNYQDTRFDHLKITAGAEIKHAYGIHYQTVDDLLGANQWIDKDPYAERDIRELAGDASMTQTDIEFVMQNDLAYYVKNGQAPIVKKNGKFGYDYRIAMTNVKAWAQNEWNWQDVDLYYALALTYSSMQRTTNMINGRAIFTALQVDHREKDSETYTRYLGSKNDYNAIRNGVCPNYLVGDAHHFVDPAFKAGLTYKINGRNRIIVNGLAQTVAPLARDAYISPRIHDRAVNDIYMHDKAKSLKDYYAASEKVVGADLTYEWNYPIVRGRITGFYTQFWNGTRLTGYYDDEVRTFVNQALTGINRRHVGAEAAISVKMGTYFTLTGAAAFGDYRYTSNANCYSTAENGMNMIEDDDTYKTILVDSVLINGLHVANGPQLNASLKLSFFHPKMWFADITVSYYDRNWLDFAPARRMKGLYYGKRDDETQVDGSYKMIYVDHDNYIDVRQKDADGNLVLDKYGTPLLEGPYKYLTEQESLVNSNPWHRIVIDASVGKLIYLKNRQSLSINVSLTNLTNNVWLKTGGYTQGRLPRSTRQGEDAKSNSTINSNIWKFPSKYYYAWGMNFYLSVTYKF